MAKFTVAVLSSLLASAIAFAPSQQSRSSQNLMATGFEEVGGSAWDPMSLGTLGTGEAFDTFPNMFPNKQYLQESEIKHGRMCMLAWTGIWATHVGGMGLGMHIPGMPDEPDWTKALGVVAQEQPALFGAILLFISIAEGEGVGHAGDNFRGMSEKEPGNMGFDPWGLKSKLSEEKQERYKIVEMKNGRAAMIAMASMFAFESIPGSVPLMDLFGAQ
uniref:Plastid light harvesting protein n=1 Tax=Grammatophora oceanica TaxID=210454 RepID=A0A7S1V782_9STRA|mmetsp:Transcript_37176/g.55387  ORF Transcript_37176/g.55387 Transcript_37176/m.55387 type:complete len:217 (+) Transcript_37176:67-717(+)|eukprot:CAMPEP_0194028024 /NCGR_PEP_ID=MMETSP0009_2-20130614/2044_1 /TAXON_ID=210454 /ORGANISM="Grammatophora oceanica, Strain CCMP 410" /LENGTH=216 /DNA_ID=CAMNT_0038667255 /DNA_START=67 /DNA_END=717 /DNA_ORIENTATION=+